MKDLIKDLKFIITASNDCEKDNKIEQLILDYINQIENEKQLTIHNVVKSSYCECDAPIIRTSVNMDGYCGYCSKDIK